MDKLIPHVAMGNESTLAFLAALGIENQFVRKVQFTLEVNRITTVTVEKIVTEEQVTALTKVLEKYNVVLEGANLG